MRSKKGLSWRSVIFAFVMIVITTITGLTGALAGGYAVYRVMSNAQQSTGQSAAVQEDTVAPEVETGSEDEQVVVREVDVVTPVTDAVEKVGPAVVTVLGTVPGAPTFFGVMQDQQISGSGVIISEQGFILSNHHVVEGTTAVSVILADGTELEAEVISSDPFADLAVLKAEGDMPAVAKLGNSDRLQPGETVIAIGSPLGTFKNSVTVGVVSATGRSLDSGRGYVMEDLVQTDAAINQGNSGGPLINLEGEIVGINTLVVRGGGTTVAEGLGFAVPSNTANTISQQIIDKGYFARPFMGVTWQAVNPLIAEQYDLPVEWGAYVTQVQPGTPADEAGIQANDIIIQIGEVEINENTSFVNALFDYQPGDEVDIRVSRGNDTVELSIVLGERQLSQ